MCLVAHPVIHTLPRVECLRTILRSFAMWRPTPDPLPKQRCRASAKRRLALLIGCAVVGQFALAHVAAQPIDTFDDGDFVAAPSWMGDVDRWQIGSLNGPALQSRGISEPDTIHLATQSGEAYGRWELAFAHEAVNLSSFNGARIFLVSDRSDARADARGYYLQMGTNNSDQISLWRADGNLRTQRSELGRSTSPLLDGDSSLVRLSIDRDIHGTFNVHVDDSLIFSASDTRYTDGAYFVIWVKHTAQGAESFLFDDIGFEPAAEEHSTAPLPRPRDLVLNEIHFDPAPGSSEFIEVFNRSDSTFDTSHLRIRDSRSNDVPVTPTSSELTPGTYLVLAQDSAAFATEFRTVPFIPIRNWPALNNSGDTIVLSTAWATIDSLEFDGNVGTKGRSLERIDPDGPSDVFNFSPSVDGFGSTPGERNSVYAIDTVPPAVVFVDQVDATTLQIYFTEPVQMDLMDIDSIEYEGIVRYVDSTSATTLTLTLGAPPEAPRLRLVGLQDLKGNTAETADVPIAFLGRAGDLVINEIMYEPRINPYDGLPDQLEFLEILNTSNRLISVAELIRTRDADESGDADTLRFGRALAAVESEGMIVIAAGDSAAVRSAYPQTSPEPSTIYVAASGFTLRNGGDRIRLHNRLGNVLDDLRYEPFWHHPDRSERRGSSLERIDGRTPSSNSTNWSSSVSLDGGSPGASNSIALRPERSGEPFGITIQPSTISPDGDGRDDVMFINYRLPDAPSNIRVRIFDLHGVEVRRLISADLTASTGSILWDGRDATGNPLRIGIYIILFEAAGPQQGSVRAYKQPIVLARRL